MRIARLFLSLLLCCPAVIAATVQDEYRARSATIDANDPDAHFQLGSWCKEQGLHTLARKHFNNALKLDPDHLATREELGFIRYRRKWVHQSRVPGSARAPAQVNDGAEQNGTRSAGATSRPSGPAPTADQIEWDLTPPPDPQPDAPFGPFLEQIIGEMANASPTTRQMEIAYRTLLKDEYLPSAVARLATAIAEGRIGRLYGPSMVVSVAHQEGPDWKKPIVDRLLPFLAHLSKTAKDPEGLYVFAYVAGAMGDKRVVPRLAELLEHANKDVVFGARFGLQGITLIPADDLTADRARSWWQRHHASSSAEIYGAGLRSGDPAVRLQACQALYDSYDKRIVPVLIDLVLVEDPALYMAAARELKRISGSDWGLIRRQDSEWRRKLHQRLQQWWEQDGPRFRFLAQIEAENQARSGGPAAVVAAPEPVDRLAGWIDQLGAPDSKASARALGSLRSQGPAIAGRLVAEGLVHGNPVVQEKVRNLLREWSGENHGFDPYLGSEADRIAARERWAAWAAQQAAAPE